MFAALASRCNDLSLWRRRLSVWGFDMTACNGDRLINLCLHRLGLMGKDRDRVYTKLLRPGWTVVDIGANQGLYSLLFSSLVGPQGRVFAFEPDPRLYDVLTENCRRNNAANVHCRNFAIGTGTEAKTLYRSRVNSGDNRLAVSGRPDWFDEVAINTAPLDSFMGDLAVNFIKIDVQGWEFEVVKGMTGVLQNNPALTVYFEFWPFGLRRAGSEPVGLLEMFRQKGFALFEVNGTAIDDPATFCSGFSGYDSTNILAVRSGSIRRHA